MIVSRRPARNYAGVVLLALLLNAIPPGVFAFTNGQAASLVLGHADFTSKEGGTSATRMYGPSGVAIDPVSGKGFVADTNNNRVLRFASNDALRTGASAEGVLGQSTFTDYTGATTARGMNLPVGIAVDQAGHLWVADIGNRRVLRFDNAASKGNGAPADGVLGQATFTSLTAAITPTGMDFPEGVAVDQAGHLWVAEYMNNRVLRFDHAASKANGAAADGVLGQATFTTNTHATTATRMDHPAYLAVDTAGHLWVVDVYNNRVLRFDHAATKANGAPADGVLGQPDFTTGDSRWTTATMLPDPGGVAVDHTGNLWIAHAASNRVLRFDAAANKANGAPADGVLGQSDFESDTPDTTANAMTIPISVSIDAGGRVWVADRDNNRVLRFDQTAPQTITFVPLPTTALSSTPLSLQATASSGLAVVFSSRTPQVCTVRASTVTFVTVGTCTIVAAQSGNAQYSAAPSVTQSFVVQAKPTGTTQSPRVYLPFATR